MKIINEKLSLFIFLFIGIFGFLSVFRPALTAVNATTTVFYDATIGGTPDTQGMEFKESNGLSFVSDAEQKFVSGATILTTTTTIGDYAGYGVEAVNMPTLDAAQGFKMTFTVQVDEELHLNNNRAGFSVILLDQNAKGIELGFWEDTIFAQEGNGPNLFTHAEDVSYNTTNEITYDLEILNSTYTLKASGVSILTGSVRDYSDNEPLLPILPDPYEAPNFVFLGDNTTSGKTVVRLKYVAVTTDTAVATNTPTPTNTAITTATATADPDQTSTPTTTPDPSTGGTPEPIDSYLPLITKP